MITTEVFRHKETIEGHPDMLVDLDLLIEKHIGFIEAITGQYYGKADNPLFFSIRSGSSISLPGAMKTFLNVGMNDEIAEAYSKRQGLWLDRLGLLPALSPELGDGLWDRPGCF